MRQFCNVCTAKVIDGACKCPGGVPPVDTAPVREALNTVTRHLDTAISILKGTAGSKRPARKAVTEVVVYMGIAEGQRAYTIQSNGKTVEEGLGDDAYAVMRANERADRIRALTGKSVSVEVF